MNRDSLWAPVAATVGLPLRLAIDIDDQQCDPEAKRKSGRRVDHPDAGGAEAEDRVRDGSTAASPAGTSEGMPSMSISGSARGSP